MFNGQQNVMKNRLCYSGSAEEPYALIGHVRDCGGSGEQSLLLPGDNREDGQGVWWDDRFGVWDNQEGQWTGGSTGSEVRSEEHTSELQSQR